MKKHHLSLLFITLAAGAALLLALGWFISDEDPSLAPVAEPQGDRLSDDSLPSHPATVADQSQRGPGTVASPTQPMGRRLAPPAGVDPFAPALADAELLRTERRMFEAQTWEVDLGKALELRPGERLERRSGLFRLAGGGGLVRLDRVYRLGGARPAPVTKAAVQQVRHAASPSPDAATAPDAPDTRATVAAGVDPTGPLEAGGGELVWANAMAADRLLVQVESGVTRWRLAAALPRLAKVGRQVTAGGLLVVEVPAEGERSVERAVLALNQLKGVVQFAEPDFVLTGADTTANDPLFTTNATDLGKQWHLAKIMTPRVWSVLTGPPFPPAHPQYQPRLDQTVVAVVDTGVDYTHPDLAPNMWTNTGETGGSKGTNGLDDDGNGKIDDWHGWNFVENNNDPMDDVGHGTHVAGTIGAVGNNATGGTGVCWKVKLLPLRIIKKQGTGTIGYYSSAIAALDYIRTLNNLGRRVAVANHSWGGSGYSLAMLYAINNPLATSDPLPAGLTGTYGRDANQLTVAGAAAEVAKIKMSMTITGSGIPAGTVVTIVDGSMIFLSNYTTAAASGTLLTFSNPIRAKPYGVVHVAAAGNSRFNSDRIPTYPACLPSGFMLSVGASDLNDSVSSWSTSAGSNYGALNVDLFAPGSSIWSTYWKPASGIVPVGFVPVPGSNTQGYLALNGTSMAGPQVAATVALMRMWQPNLTELQARQVLIDQAEVNTVLKGQCMSGGRLNVAKVLDKLYQPILTPGGGATGGGSSTITDALQAAKSVTGRLAVGLRNTLFVDQGEVWAWGDNTYGSLGNGTTTSSAVPVKVQGLSEITMVTVTQSPLGTNFALKADGTVWVWGNSRLHGDDTSHYEIWLVPHKIAALTDIVWISVGYNHCLALRADGKVMQWGGTPVEVNGLSDIVQVHANGKASLALRKDGTVYAWGYRGQIGELSNPLGDGPITSEYANTPIMVPGIGDVVFVAGTYAGSLFLKSDGTVWLAGQVARAAIAETPINLGLQTLIPTQIPGLSDIRVVAGGFSHALALDSEGKLFSWGTNIRGELGTGSVEAQSEPVEVPLPNVNGVVACAAGSNVSLILDLDGNLWSSGTNHTGQLGGGIFPSKVVPIQNKFLTGITAIGGRNTMAWARKSDGTFYTWGDYNLDSATGTPVAFRLPNVYPTLGVQVESACAGIDGGTATIWAARGVDGSLWTWGNPASGGLGRTTTATLQPTKIEALSNIVSVSCGLNFMLALDTGGHVYQWGQSANGEPALFPGLSEVIQISAGTYNRLALKGDGTVWQWRGNGNSQQPERVQGLGNVVQIECYALFWISGGANYALTSDGALYLWNQSASIAQLMYRPADGRITKFARSNYRTIALLSDHTVVSWGDSGRFVDGTENYLGRAPGSTASATTPSPIFGATDVVDIAPGAGDGTFIFLKSDGTVWSWGYCAPKTEALYATSSGNTGLGDSWSESFGQVVSFGGNSSNLFTLGTGNLSDSWNFQNFSLSELLDNSVVGDLADASGDGIPNLIKYALGLNPRAHNAPSSLPGTRVDVIVGSSESGSAGNPGSEIQLFATPTVDLTDGKHYQAFTVNRSNAGIRQDIDYLVEVSADLQNWMSGDPFTITVLDTAETLEVYDATAIEDAQQRFMRLKIQRR